MLTLVYTAINSAYTEHNMVVTLAATQLSSLLQSLRFVCTCVHCNVKNLYAVNTWLLLTFKCVHVHCY
jgi:hypothetical protein